MLKFRLPANLIAHKTVVLFVVHMPVVFVLFTAIYYIQSGYKYLLLFYTNDKTKMKRIFTALLSITIFSFNTYAQPGCPAIDAGADVSIICGQNNCVTLTAVPFLSGITNDYSVSSIAYTPFQYNVGTSILVNIDDVWSNTISLPFDFCFYGATYNQLVVGSNGIISFDLSYAGNFCPWALGNAIPSANNPLNSIMGAYHDIDPSVAGNVYYQVTGTYPCRTFIVSWNEVAMFSCTNQIATHQIVLYETTNAIEVYIQEKPICSAWNAGTAIVGIQDATGTQAVVAPGRNYPTQWSATNEAWRFTPNGPPAYTLAWYDMGNNIIGSSDTLQVCPLDTFDYAAEITYFTCDGNTVLVRDTVRVNSQQTFSATITGINPISCFNGNNGQVSATVTGGTGPVTYGWSPGGAGQLSLAGLSAGNYMFTVADAVCTFADTVSLNNPSQLVVTVPDSNTLTCNTAGNIAGLRALVTGGTAPYAYLWSNGATTANLGGVAAGTYSLQITDANGCVSNGTGNATITQTPVAFSNPVITNVLCFGGSTGSITANAINAIPTVTYSWSNGGSGATISNLAAGSYTVTANDANGCSASATYAVNQPASALSGNINVANVSCFGGADGSATAIATGGTAPYTYNWSSGGAGTPINNLPAGNISVTITDANNCTAANSSAITSPVAITATETLDLRLCANPPYGNVTIAASGGSGTYAYNVAGVGNNTSGVYGNVLSGSYAYTVTDNNNCSYSDNFIIPAGNPDSFIVSTTPTSCYGSQFTDGTIQIVPVVAANGPFQYSFNNGAFQANNLFNNLAAGSYNVVVQNNNACFDTLNITVSQPAQALVTAAPDTFLVQPNAPTQITLSTQNFTSPVYNWSPAQGLSCTDCFNPTATVNQYSVFSVIVSEADNSQCSAADTVVFIVLGGVVMPDAFTPNGDGRNDNFGPVSYGNIVIKDFRVYNRWGDIVHTGIDAWNGKFDDKEQAAGTYQYFIAVETPDPENPGQIKSVVKQGAVSLLR